MATPLLVNPYLNRFAAKEAARIRLALLALVVGFAAVAVLSATSDSPLYSAIFGAAVMLGVFVFMPACQPRQPYLSPYNWAFALFFLELVVIPANMMTAGVSRGTLPALPAASSIEYSYLLTVLGYLSFSVAYSSKARRPMRKAERVRAWWVMSKSLGAAYILLGLLGFGLIFSLSSLIAYYASPVNRVADSATTTLAAAASTFLRPFAAFGAVGLWCRLVDAKVLFRWGVLLTGLGCAGITSVVFITYGYNRATIAAPLVCLTAVVVRHVKKLPLWLIVVAGIPLLAVLSFVGQYRTARTLGLSDVLSDREVASSLGSKIDASAQLQIYSSGPQFSAYLLENTEWGRHLFFGRSLFGTLMYTVPILGKRWREDSGLALYNNMIYGNAIALDQPVPFVGELFMNFHVIGVIAGFATVGYFIRHLQERFEKPGGALRTFALQYITIWLCYTIHSSILVVAQMFVYFCPPIYVLMLLSYLRRRSRQGHPAAAAVVRAGA